MADLQDVRNQDPDNKNLEEAFIIINTYKQKITDLETRLAQLEGGGE